MKSRKYKQVIGLVLLMIGICYCGTSLQRRKMQDSIRVSEQKVVPRDKVYVAGLPVGIYLETKGVLVIDTGKIQKKDGSWSCPAEAIIQPGDYVQAVNGQQVATKEELISCIQNCRGSDITFQIIRENEEKNLKVHPVQDETGEYRAGIWIRNDTQGIGTLTYITQDGSYAALGHGISDIDTGEILQVKGGSLYQAEVLSVTPGRQGIPGEVSGVIHYSDGYKIGEIQDNRSNGIYGKIYGGEKIVTDLELCEVAYKQETQIGNAQIVCAVDGKSQKYDVQIKSVRMNDSDEYKGLLLEVTDPRLLELTGGIVQGMSGSPILQHGRLVGAVTHVLVNDPSRGYGILAENMLR